VPAGLSNVTAISTAGTHALALRADGTVVVWRKDEIYSPNVTNMPAGLSNVTAIATGDSFSLVLRSDGTVTGWGYNFYGQLDVPAGLSNVIGIACGEFHSLAILQDRTVVAWGAGGAGSNSWPNIGQSIVPYGLTNVSGVSGGYFYSLALNDGSPALKKLPTNQTAYTGTTVVFDAEAVGPGPFTYRWQHEGSDVPAGTTPSLILTNVQLADAGRYRLLVSNQFGVLVSPEAALEVVTSGPLIQQQPVGVTVLVGSNATMSVGAIGSLPIDYQWRRNGEALVGATGAAMSLTNLQIAAGGTFDVVLTNAFGSVTSAPALVAATPSYVVGWGRSVYGQTNHPVGLTNVVAVAAGYSHSLALQENGVVVAWGGSGSGNTNVPEGLSNVVAISAGDDFSVALRGDGRPVAWGDNYFQQDECPGRLEQCGGDRVRRLAHARTEVGRNAGGLGLFRGV
jgi:hypothetical protein